jgi:hypothetical protein
MKMLTVSLTLSAIVAWTAAISSASESPLELRRKPADVEGMMLSNVLRSLSSHSKLIVAAEERRIYREGDGEATYEMLARPLHGKLRDGTLGSQLAELKNQLPNMTWKIENGVLWIINTEVMKDSPFERIVPDVAFDGSARTFAGSFHAIDNRFTDMYISTSRVDWDAAGFIVHLHGKSRRLRDLVGDCLRQSGRNGFLLICHDLQVENSNRAGRQEVFWVQFLQGE